MKILLIDDDPAVRSPYSELIASFGHECTALASGEAALDLIEKNIRAQDTAGAAPANGEAVLKLGDAIRKPFDLAIIDLRLTGIMNGIEAGERIHHIAPDIKLLLLTAYNNDELQQKYNTDPMFSSAFYGIYDKPLDSYRLKAILEDAQLTQGTRNIHAGIIGESPKLIETLELAGKYVDNLTPILITGETGTGKELIAHLLHQESCRKNKSYVSVNCGAIPSSLLASELFGHKKGAFTGADADKKGFFEKAHNGTIFLDEIDKMPFDQQAALLRILDCGGIQPVGAAEEKKVVVRIIAASSSNLKKMIAENTFRADLYYRFSGLIHMPPLRKRGNDVLFLANYFLKKCLKEAGQKRTVTFDAESQRRLLAYQWPGNVRELESCVLQSFTNLDKKAAWITVRDLYLEGKPLPENVCEASRSDQKEQSTKTVVAAGYQTINDITEYLNNVSLHPELDGTSPGDVIQLQKAFIELEYRVYDNAVKRLRGNKTGALSHLVGKDLGKPITKTDGTLSKKRTEMGSKMDETRQKFIDFYQMANPGKTRNDKGNKRQDGAVTNQTEEDV